MRRNLWHCYAMAAEARVSQKTLNRAKEGIAKSYRADGHWMWELLPGVDAPRVTEEPLRAVA